MTDETRIDVYLGLDVGKGDHHATAVNRAGKKVFDKPLPNSEPKLRELFGKLQAKHGTVLVVVDQPASIGALPLAVARDAGCQVAYLPGLTMRRIADLYPGEAKTDARDAFIIADAARAMPHTLRTIDPSDETVAELAMIAGFDDDHAGESTRIANRLRGLITQIHPSLERVLGPRIQHPAVLRLLDQFGSPAQIRKAGRRRLVTLIRPKAPRMAERLVEDIFTALDEQTVVVPGTDAAALIVPSLASSLQSVLDQRKLLAARIEELLEAHSGSRPDQEPAVCGRLRYPEAGWQGPPRTAADQHVNDRGEQRLNRRVLRSAALRPHIRRRNQRFRDLPQPVRNNPTPRTPPPCTTQRPPHHIGHGLGGRSRFHCSLLREDRAGDDRLTCRPLMSYGPAMACGCCV